MTQADRDSVPDAVTAGEDGALFTIDLSGSGPPENAGQTVGRVAGGLLLLIIGAAIGLASLFFYVGGWVFPWIPEWMFFEDLLLIPGALGLGIAITGLTLMRRTRRRRAQEAAEEAAFLESMKAGTPPPGVGFAPASSSPETPKRKPTTIL
ncbi:hypothetical protein BH10ACT7_BH10ACT7_13440 [soil metagenome]